MKHFGSVLDSVKTPMLNLTSRERGVTGLETAIILIAFVVVASVFAFTVLSTGIFSAERGKETVFAGLEQARGSVELKGSVIANGVADVTVSDAETLWQQIPANASTSLDSVDKKVGSNSGELAVTTNTGLLAYEIISPTINLSNYDSISIWIKSSLSTTAVGDLTLRISDDGTSCGTGGNYEDLALPVLTAATWKATSVGITDSTVRTAVACIGLVAAVAYAGAATVNFDEIIAQGQVTSIVVLVANSVEGEPVNLTEPSDSDADGIADSEDRRHQLIVTYTDADQLKNDLYWTKSFIGSNDSDDLLEVGERVEITVETAALDQATPLTRDKQFTLEVKPTEGSVLVIQRRTPDKIDTVMNMK